MAKRITLATPRTPEQLASDQTIHKKFGHEKFGHEKPTMEQLLNAGY